MASVVVFAVLDLLPGNVAQVMLGESATPEAVAALEARLGLDRPAPVRYLDWLRGNSKPQYDEAKKQGLIMDWKVFIPSQRMSDGTDIVICALFPSYGKALDYSKADEEKWDAISAARLKTADEKQQMEMSAPRLKMRRYTGTIYLREAALKPLN